MKKLFSKLRSVDKSLSESAPKTEKKDNDSKIAKKAVINGVHLLYSPMEGEIVELSKVPEIAFSGKMLGDGFTIIPTENSICSPANGEVVVLFPTNHDIVILTEEGIEILIHIGINTASLNGEGFTAHVKKGAKVKKGDMLITFDSDVVKERGKNLITPVIMTNMNVVKKLSIDFGEKKVQDNVAEVII